MYFYMVKGFGGSVFVRITDVSAAVDVLGMVIYYYVYILMAIYSLLDPYSVH